MKIAQTDRIGCNVTPNNYQFDKKKNIIFLGFNKIFSVFLVTKFVFGFWVIFR